MADTQQLPLSIQPVISYPREAQVGKKYLMTVDLQTSGNEWPYEEEEYPIYCKLETYPLFISKPLRDTTLVLHRFGGTYGAAKFLLTAAQEEIEGEIRVALVNRWGVPVKVLNLSDIKVRQDVDESNRSTSDVRVKQDVDDSHRGTKDLETSLEAYQKALLERYAHLNLDSLDNSTYDYREKLKVQRVFTAQNVRECQEFLPQVYEIPKEAQRRLGESNQQEAGIDPELWEQYKQFYYQQPVRSVLHVTEEMWSNDRYRYLVILGDPGSGKSILLQYLALDWARSPLDNIIEQTIPLLIELRTYNRSRNSGECKDLLECFHKGDVIHRLTPEQLKERLQAGKALVMFDGLDEVFNPEQREQVINDIHRFTNDYPQVRVIVTSRIIGYKPQRLQDAEFRHFLLQDLDSEQIHDFIDRWHELTFIDEADKRRKRERLQRAIDTSKAIRELAGNPLLLTMMAILNRNQELPRDRPELYNQASRVLLHQWDVERKLLQDPRIAPVTIDSKDKQEMLRKIAHFMQGENKGLAGNLIRGSDLEKILSEYLKDIEVNNPRIVARLMIEQLRSRNFILCFLGGEYYGFVHRTFLEYFCALEYVCEFKETRHLTIKQLITEVFGKHWQDQSWQEVLRLIAGMINAKFVGPIIKYLIEQKINRREFLDKNGRLRKEGVQNLLLAANCFAELRRKSPSIADALQTALKQEVEQESPHQFNAEAADAIVSAIATVGQNTPQTLDWLKFRLQSDSNSHIRKSALQAIAQYGQNDPDTLPLLRNKAQSDQDRDVRSTAVVEIARGWKGDPDTLPLLHDKAQFDKSGIVRSAAVEKIARGWKDDFDTLSLLQQKAKSDKDWHVQRVVIKEIARGWKGDPQTLSLLQEKAKSDQDRDVRSLAIEEIAHGWKDEPWMLEFLRDCVLNDPFKRRRYDWEDNPRQSALELIIQQYPHDSPILDLLRDRAEKDSDEQVRKFAKDQLEKLERQSI
ncbi:MAG: NACHT domain-containing protein [Symploca sp. SIO2E6]|nr:NACHT domain-containing protein [Symploca sp. SIO2E6]